MIKTCPTCQQQFKSHHYQQKYCCAEHAGIATKERKRIEREELQVAEPVMLGQVNNYTRGVETCDVCHSKQNIGTLALNCWKCRQPLGTVGPFRLVRGGPIVGY